MEPGDRNTMGKLSLKLSAQKPRLKMTSTHVASVFSIKGWELKALYRTRENVYLFLQPAVHSLRSNSGRGWGRGAFAILFKTTELNPGLGQDRKKSHPLPVAEVPCLGDPS